jgi:hypothetical protein
MYNSEVLKLLVYETRRLRKLMSNLIICCLSLSQVVSEFLITTYEFRRLCYRYQHYICRVLLLRVFVDVSIVTQLMTLA